MRRATIRSGSRLWTRIEVKNDGCIGMSMGVDAGPILSAVQRHDLTLREARKVYAVLGAAIATAEQMR